jgi:Bacterial Ig-like domain (group 3)
MKRHWLGGLKVISLAPGKESRGRRGRGPVRLEALEGRVLLSGATVYTVNSAASNNSGTGNSGTLPYVIGQANIDSNPAGSEIDFDPTIFSAATPQTITLSRTLELAETAGPVTIDGPGPSTLTISGGQAVGVFLVDSGVTATLSGLSITDGWSEFGGGAGNGGGICNNGGALTVNNCDITDNFAQASGGGIYSSGGQVNIKGGCNISNNRAIDFGGGVSSDGILKITGSSVNNNSEHSGEGGGLYFGGGTATVSSCTFSSNAASSGEGKSSGGGIFVRSGSLTLTGSTLSANSAGDAPSEGVESGANSSSGGDGGARSEGGGLFNSCGHVHMTNCNLSNNVAQGAGGGVFNARGTLEIDGSTMTGNSAVHGGGGIFIAGGTLTINDSTISANSSEQYGGGIANEATVTIINSTITNNSAFDGAGIWTNGVLTAVYVTIVRNQNTGAFGPGAGLDAVAEDDGEGEGEEGQGEEGTPSSRGVTLDNTIIALNTGFTSSELVADDIAGTVSGSFNLIGTGGSGGLTNTDGNQVGVSDLFLGTLRSNGGNTQTIALLPGSPAIGAGSDSISGVDVPAMDQRGVARPSESVDIGAFQDQGFTITILGDGPSQSTMVNTPFANALSVEVTSAAGDPVMGGVVTFVAPSSGGSASLSAQTATISCRGDAASVTAIANSTAGSYHVTAMAAGAAAPAVFALTNTLPQPVPQDTAITLTSSLSPSTVGQIVTFTATVAPTVGTGTPTGTVTFTINGHAGSPVTVTEVNGKDQATVVMPALGAGHYTITASYSGDANFAPSLSSTATQIVSPLPVNPTPVPPPIVVDPTIVAVERFGFHRMRTTLVLKFSHAVDATIAQDSKEYRIINPAGKVISVKSAVYNPTLLTVTLHPKNRINIHHASTLIVYGTAHKGLTSAEDKWLDGAGTGQPGSDYHTRLTWRNLVLPASSRSPKKSSAKLNLKSAPAHPVSHAAGLFTRSLGSRR